MDVFYNEDSDYATFTAKQKENIKLQATTDYDSDSDDEIFTHNKVEEFIPDTVIPSDLTKEINNPTPSYKATLTNEIPTSTGKEPQRTVHENSSPSSSVKEHSELKTKQVTTKSGRVTTQFILDTPTAYLTLEKDILQENKINFTITTEVNKFHTTKKKTPGQHNRMVKRIIQSKIKKIPGVFSDLKNLTTIDRSPYYKATKEEFRTLLERKVVKLVRLDTVPNGFKTKIGKLVVLLNTKRDGRVKARCVYVGSHQKVKLLENKKSPTLDVDTVHICLSLATKLKWHFFILDVKCAFLYANLPFNAKLYAQIPAGYPGNIDKTIYILEILKNLYGTKEGPAIWFNWIKKLMLQMGFKQSSFDCCLFYKNGIFVLIYVDDILTLGKQTEIISFREEMQLHVEITYSKIAKPADFLGITIKRSSTGEFSITQKDYIANILYKYRNFPKSDKLTPIPIKFTTYFETTSKMDEKFPYKQIVGSIMYLRFTRIDILYALHKLSCFNQKYDETCKQAVLHLLGYLQRTQLFEKKFFTDSNKSLKLVAFTDADWATNTIDRKSVSGHIIYLGCNHILAKSYKQKRVRTSSTGAELNEICTTAKKMEFILGLCNEITILVETPFVILTDSKSSVNALESNIAQGLKHLSIYVKFLKDMVENKLLRVLYICRDKNIADMMVKQQPLKIFRESLDALKEPFLWREVTVDIEDK